VIPPIDVFVNFVVLFSNVILINSVPIAELSQSTALGTQLSMLGEDVGAEVSEVVLGTAIYISSDVLGAGVLGTEVLGTEVVGLTDVGDDVLGVVLGLAVVGFADDGAVVLGVVLGKAVVGLMDVGAEVIGVVLGLAVVGLTDVGAEVVGVRHSCGRTTSQKPLPIHKFWPIYSKIAPDVYHITNW
jgi:hypothetical protein